MQRIALIDDTGTVVNVAVFPDDWTGDSWDDHQAVPVPDEVGPGWTRAADGEWVVPSAAELPPVSMAGDGAQDQSVGETL